MKKIFSLLIIMLFSPVCVLAGPPCPAPHVLYDPAHVALTGGTIDDTVIGETTASNATFQDTIKLKDANGTHIIKSVLEPGLGSRLTLGLDETARTMVICDAGDVDTDLGLVVSSHPRITLLSNSGTVNGVWGYGLLQIGEGKFVMGTSAAGVVTTGRGTNGYYFQRRDDLAAGNAFYFQTYAAGNGELIDTNAEQSWLYIEPEINQTATAAYNGLKIKVTETSTGDATTGDGGGTNNLILAGTSTDPDMFKVDNDGDLTMSVGKLSAAAMTFVFTTEVDITDPLTGSVVLLDGDNDGENDTIDLQNGTTAGQVLYLIAAVDIDVNDTCTINYGDTTCTNCPATVFDKVGENAHLIWTGSTWAVISIQDAL